MLSILKKIFGSKKEIMPPVQPAPEPNKNWMGVSLPLVNKIISTGSGTPGNMMNDIMSVQPMNAPSSQIFYMDFKYNKPKTIKVHVLE